MKYYKEHDIEGHVAEMHEIVAPFMDEMVKKHKCIGEARCIGLFGALEVVKNKETREPMQEYGVPTGNAVDICRIKETWLCNLWT